MIVLHTADFISLCLKTDVCYEFRRLFAQTALLCVKSKQVLLLLLLMKRIRTAIVQNQLWKFSIDGKQTRSHLCHCCSVHSSPQVTSSQCCCGICRASLYNNILPATFTLTKVKEPPPPKSPHAHQSCQYKHYSPSIKTHQVNYSIYLLFILNANGSQLIKKAAAGLTFRWSTIQTLRPLQHWASQKKDCGGKDWRSGPGSR